MSPNRKRVSQPMSKVTSYHPPLVISLHGIRTRGEWQKVLAATITGMPTRVESFDYGTYGLVRFLTPGFNERLVDRFYDWYGMVLKSCPGVDLDAFDRRPCVVAHSLGSWILGNAMLKFEDIRFDKIILAGSILPRDFDWSSLLAKDQTAAVRNECGQKDPWPGWASRLVSRSGTGGKDGFEWLGSAVENARCDWFGHSDALMRTHIERCWLPFLKRVPSPLGLLHGCDIQDGAEFCRLLDHTGTVIDPQAYGGIPYYADVVIPRGLSTTWIRINPDIYTFLMDRRTRIPAGYINAMPINLPAYEELRCGGKADNEIEAEDLLPYSAGSTLRLYVMSIAVDEQYRRWGDGIFQQSYIQLLNGFLDRLTYYAKTHSVRVTHLLATAWTPEGRRMCNFFGMEEVGKDRFRDAIFELDLSSPRLGFLAPRMPGLRKLLKAYSQLRS